MTNVDPRIEQITNLIIQLASGNLESRLPPSEARDDLDAIIIGLNMLAEALMDSTVSRGYVNGIVNSMLDTLIVVNSDATIHTVNQATVNLLGYFTHELIGQSIDLIIPEAREQSAVVWLRDLIDRGVVQNLETTYQARNGRQIPMMISSSIMQSSKNRETQVIFVGMDITEQIITAEQIRQMNRKLENKTIELERALVIQQNLNDSLTKASRKLEKTQSQLVQSSKLAALGEMATGVAHEINQPLFAIKVSAKNLIKSIKKGYQDNPLTTLTTIVAQVDRASEIINHLRTFGWDTSRSSKVKNDINVIVRNAMALIQEQLRLRDILVNLELSDTLPGVLCHAIQIEQVIINLIMNAKDALEKNEYKTVDISSFQDGNCVVVQVKDNGEGIPSDIQDRIFDPFFTTKEVGKGTGLGLSISYGIMKDHNGRLEVESCAGCGCLFRVYLPAIV